MSDKKLLDRIEKLLNLGSSPNANEAAAALQKATQLMEEYNLSQKDLDRNQIGRVEIKSTQSVSQMKDWELWLMQTVGKAFGMKVLWRAGRTLNNDGSKNKDYWGRFVLIGPKGNLELAEYTATYLLRLLIKERVKFYTRLSLNGGFTKKELTAELDGFCKGWVRIISSKVYSFANSPELQSIIDDYINDTIKGRPGVKAESRGHGYIGDFAGEKAAADVDIYRPMNQEERFQIESKS